MIIKTYFSKAALFSVNCGRRVFARLINVYNVGKVVFASNTHLAAPAGSSIYGVLISGDTARQWL